VLSVLVLDSRPGRLVSSCKLFQGLGTDQFQNLNQLLGVGGAGQGLAQGQLGDWLSYLQAGTGADANAIAKYKAQLDAQKQQFGENQVFGQGIGKALGGMGSSMGWGGGGGSALGMASMFI